MFEIKDKEMIFSLKSISLAKTVIIVSLITIALFIVDWLTGSVLSFSIFYLIPITLAVLLSGKRLGLIFSVVCSITWITADILANARYSSVFIPIWNSLVRFGYFVFHTILLSRLNEIITEMHAISVQDPLTNTANWRKFEEFANLAIKSAVKERKYISLAYIDIDNFKAVNDVLGHSGGDEALQLVSSRMKEEVRSIDIVARLGGDEFAILLYDADLKQTEGIIDRIQRSVKETMKDRNWNITLSIGAIVFKVLPSTVGPMIKRADDLMYEVKRNGKNSAKIVEQFA